MAGQEATCPTRDVSQGIAAGLKRLQHTLDLDTPGNSLSVFSAEILAVSDCSVLIYEAFDIDNDLAFECIRANGVGLVCVHFGCYWGQRRRRGPRENAKTRHSLERDGSSFRDKAES